MKVCLRRAGEGGLLQRFFCLGYQILLWAASITVRRWGTELEHGILICFVYTHVPASGAFFAHEINAKERSVAHGGACRAEQVAQHAAPHLLALGSASALQPAGVLNLRVAHQDVSGESLIRKRGQDQRGCSIVEGAGSCSSWGEEDLMRQICERALSKRFAHRDLLLGGRLLALHRFSVESMAMVGCVFVGKALVRAPKLRRFVAPCEESAGCVHREAGACEGVAAYCSCSAAWLGCRGGSRGASPSIGRFISHGFLALFYMT